MKCHVIFHPFLFFLLPWRNPNSILVVKFPGIILLSSNIILCIVTPFTNVTLVPRNIMLLSLSLSAVPAECHHLRFVKIYFVIDQITSHQLISVDFHVPSITVCSLQIWTWKWGSIAEDCQPSDTQPASYSCGEEIENRRDPQVGWLARSSRKQQRKTDWAGSR